MLTAKQRCAHERNLEQLVRCYVYEVEWLLLGYRPIELAEEPELIVAAIERIGAILDGREEERPACLN